MISRRSFITGGALAMGTAAIAGAGLAGCATASESEEVKPWFPETWDDEADMIVVGYGGAGIAAAITANKENLGDCLVLEAAPEGEEGGNSRVCAQLIYCPRSVDGAVEYQANLNGPYVVDDDVMQAWAKGVAETVDWLDSLGIETEESHFNNPEFPEVAGSDAACTYMVLASEGKMGSQKSWIELSNVANELGINILNNNRVTDLVYDPISQEVLGVKAQTSDGEKYYKARKGVILSCGGFENNPEMIRDYYQIGYPEVGIFGTPYNRGDGIKMAQAVGADLWHMNNFSNTGYGIKVSTDEDMPCVGLINFANKAYILVGGDGKRFDNEDTAGFYRHGKYKYSGTSSYIREPVPTYAVFGSELFNAEGCVVRAGAPSGWANQLEKYLGTTNQEYLDAGIIVTADTVEELAEKINVNPVALAETVNRYNENALAGSDPEFARGEDLYSNWNPDAEKPTIEAYDLETISGPYYAVRLYTATLNTQGGPRRSALGEVLNTHGEPIKRLYSAGEMGTIYGNDYNGGGNLAEAWASGRIAVRNASTLEPWDATSVEA